jgi:hypothetical protein
LRQNNAIISNSKYPKSKPVYFDQSASSIPGAIHTPLPCVAFKIGHPRR